MENVCALIHLIVYMTVSDADDDDGTRIEGSAESEYDVPGIRFILLHSCS